MSRYSSNLPSASPGVRSPFGFWMRARPPASSSPSRFQPPSCVFVVVWADASAAAATTRMKAQTARGIRTERIGYPLACQPEARGMVGAMDGHVAVVAGAPHHELLLG